MTAANFHPESWWNWIIALSWQMAVLVAIAGIVSFGLRRAAARIRHVLWLLVLMKVFLPVSLSAPWSIGTWIIRAADETAIVSGTAPATPATATSNSPAGEPASHNRPDFVTGVFAIWLIVALGSSSLIAFQYLSLCRKLASWPVIDEGPICIALERAALRLHISDPPELRLTEETSSPFLVGTFHPAIVIPRSLAEQARPDELETILLHELIHFKHRDTWIGWGQAIVQSLMWFHPLVWIANAFVNHEREIVCDEAVLQYGRVTSAEYGETILRVLSLRADVQWLRAALSVCSNEATEFKIDWRVSCSSKRIENDPA